MGENPIFISYSRKQLYFAEALSLALHKKGLDVWMDLQQLEPGSDWQDEIDAALRHCSALVLVASKQSLASPHVEGEWRAVKDSGKPIYVAYYEELVLPAEMESVSLVDFRGSFVKAIDVLAAALTKMSSVREKVQPPNRLGLPYKIPPMMMLIAGLLVLEALISPWQILSSELPTLFTGTLAITGSVYLIVMAWHLLHRKYVVLASRMAFYILLFNFIPSPPERQGLIPQLGWWLVTVVPLVLLAIAIYLLPQSRLGADLLRWSAPREDAELDALRRRFNARRPAEDRQVRVFRRQILAARNPETQAGAEVEAVREPPAPPPMQEGTQTYTLHYAPPDSPAANSLRNALNKQSLQEVQSNARVHIVILSEKLPRSTLEEVLDSDSRTILILISNITFQGDALLEKASSLQLVDYRNRSETVLQALAQTLKESTEGNLPLGFETVPLPLNSTILPPSLLMMASIVGCMTGWLILSSAASLVQRLGDTAPVPVLIWAGLVGGLISIRLGSGLLQRETTNARFVPVLLISAWLAVPLVFGSACFLPAQVDDNAPFDWPITLHALLTEPTYWGCLIFPGGLVVAGIAIAWRKRLGDWLPASVSKPHPEDRFKAMAHTPLRQRSWIDWIVLLLLVGFYLFGYPAGLSALMAFFESRP